MASPTGASAAASAGGGTASGSPAPPSQAQGQGQAQGPVLEEALLILKWGGVLTHAGRQQAEDLGKIYRMVMYPRWGAGDV